MTARRAKAGAPAWHAIGAVPAELVQAFSAAGWRRSEVARDALLVRGVRRGWDAAIDELAASPERQRARTVLVGDDPPPDIGERIRATGGLAWIAPPWPAWMFELLGRTLERTRKERPLHRVHAVTALEDVAGTSPVELLRALAGRAVVMLGGEAEVWMRGRPGLPFSRIHGDHSPPLCPSGLAEAALRFAAPVVLPWLAAARVCGPSLAERPSAVAVPLHRETAPDEPAAVLVLAWAEPFLPTVAEVRLLELLGVIGRLALQRLFERERLVSAHGEHARALASLLPSSDVGDARPGVDELVERVLAARAGHPELLELHARLQASSRGSPAWHHWQRSGPMAPDAALDRTLDWVFPGEPGARDDGRWVMFDRVGPDGGLGCILGVFSSRPAAVAGASLLSDLASALELGARVLRWSQDSGALDALSQDATRGADPGPALDRMIARICERMSSDGARVHVVRRTAAGASPICLRAHGPAAPDLPDVVERVLRTGAWQQSASADGTWHLCAPLLGAEGSAGVLEVYRVDTEPYDGRLDTDALLRFVPHVAAAARRVVHHGLLEARLAAMAGLLDALVPEVSVHDAALEVAAQTGRLAGAAAALLMRRAPGDDGAIYIESVWAADEGLRGTLREAGPDLRPGPGPAPWTDHLRVELDQWLDAWGLSTLRPRVLLASPHLAGAHPTSAVLLLDVAPPIAELAPFAPEAEDDAAKDLVRYAAALAENATRATARAAAEKLATVPSDPERLLEACARVVRETTGVDAVLLGTGDRAGVRLVYADPDRTSLSNLALPADTLSPEVERQLARAYGWRSLRAARGFTIEDRGRRLGVMWALSGDRGPMIGWHRSLVLRQIAARLALELYRARRRRRLEDLNAASSRVAGQTGRALATALHTELTAWAQRYLRPDVLMVVVARAHGQQPLVTGAPEGWDEAVLRVVHQTSRRWGVKPQRIRPGDLDEVPQARHLHGLAAPIVLREAEQLTGHVIALHPVPFDEDQTGVLDDAARELAVVLDAERVRHGFMAETGLFRHALLSPIQGLTDAALFLADLAGETPVDLDLVDEQRARILMEAEKVRRWKSIQRLYGGGLLGGEIRLQARRQPIRPVVEMCVERFRVTMQRRRISLSLEWDPRAPAHLSFDADALDIVLSNLLDNAAKYAFTSRPVTVGFHADRRGAWLWVQDIGHAVPDDVDVYAAGERMRWTDPFRSIHGEGLGLVIVRSLVIAHGGDVHHECRPENAHVPAARQETRPYVVRFTVMLPKEE